MSSCAFCGVTPSDLRCGKCRRVVYCSAEHQRADWKAHKSTCAASSAAPPAIPAGAVSKPPAAARSALPPPSAAGTRPPPATEPAPSATDNESRAVSLLHGLRTLLSGDAERWPAYLKQGAIGAMLAPGGFARSVYPGSETSSTPRSLAAFLSSHSDADLALQREAAVRAVERGTAILAGVRRKGAEEGDALTAAMEATLWPQVFAEAFARDLPLAASRRAAAATSAAAAGDANLASPFHVLAGAERAGPACVAGLCDADKGCGLGDGGPFAGEPDPAAWMSLVQTDCARFSAAEVAGRWTEPSGSVALYALAAVPPSPPAPPPPGAAGASPGSQLPEVKHAPPALEVCVGVATRVAWLDVSVPHPSVGAAASSVSALGAEYPALFELVQRLSGLPYELNRKLPRLRLSRPLPGLAQLREVSVEVWVGEAASGKHLAAGGAASALQPSQLRQVELFPLGEAFRLDAPELQQSAAAAASAPDVGVKLACVAGIGGRGIDLAALPEGVQLSQRSGAYSLGALLAAETDAPALLAATTTSPASAVKSCKVFFETGRPLPSAAESSATAASVISADDSGSAAGTHLASTLDCSAVTGIDDGCALYRAATVPARWRVSVGVSDAGIAESWRATLALMGPPARSSAAPGSAAARTLDGKHLVARHTTWAVTHWYHGQGPAQF